MTDDKITSHLLYAILSSINTTNLILVDANAERLSDLEKIQELLNEDQTAQSILMELLDGE